MKSAYLFLTLLVPTTVNADESSTSDPDHNGFKTLAPQDNAQHLSQRNVVIND